MNRSDALAALGDHPDVSVLIVGGGINGIGTFRDLALNGVDVLLVERADFCSGASAASSHMAHGGIRYLENGDFRLVREAVQERNRLIRNAPHLVHPLPTTIPIFRRFSGLLNAPLKFLGLLDRPSERGALIIKLGLLLYDAYTGRQRVVPKHQFLGRRESVARWRELNPAVTHTATYFDGAIMQPERLGLELLLDAEASNPDAHALNYVGLVGHADGHVTVQDAISGADYAVRPRLVLNAAGPWIDLANQSLGLQTRFIGGTKGSHLVLNHPQLRAAIGDHEFFFENKDGRIVLIFPLFDRVLVGTSDIPTGSPDEAVCSEDEVDYFLEMIGRVFPAIRVGREHIVFRFSGVRPLGASKSKTAGQITRDHEIQIAAAERTGLPFPVYSLVGGKWTSFRAFSEQVAGAALAFLGLERTADTQNLPIGGGRDFPLGIQDRATAVSGIAAAGGVPTDRAELLLSRYGTRATAVADFIRAGTDAPLRSLPDYSRGEIGFIARHEKVVRLDDLLLRRTMLAMLGRLDRAAVQELAAVLADNLGWSSERRQEEVSRSLVTLDRAHNVSL